MEINYPFQYTIDPLADEPIMLILNEIGNETDNYGYITNWGIQGGDFCKELMLLDTMGKSRIQIWINSIGGNVIDGYSILAAMLKSKTKVDTYNIGVAASTAGWLFEAGRTRDMSDYATWMGHNPQGEDSEIKERMRKSIIKIIAERTGKDEDEVGKMLDRETYMNADECLANGFCDKITTTNSLNIKRMSTAATIKDKYKLALEISNIAPIKTPVMAENKIDISITNKLELDQDASTAMVNKAIDSLKNKLTVAEDKVTTADEALKVSNKAKTDLQKKYDDLCKEVADMKKKIEDEETENRLKDATDMVNAFAQAGKIENKPEIIKDWIEDAKVSKEAFDKVKNRINALPVNKEAKKLQLVTTIPGASGGGPKNAAQRMLEIARKAGQK